jgi:hypothetical protein
VPVLAVFLWPARKRTAAPTAAAASSSNTPPSHTPPSNPETSQHVAA